jgi:hypothetical protein
MALKEEAAAEPSPIITSFPAFCISSSKIHLSDFIFDLYSVYNNIDSLKN